MSLSPYGGTLVDRTVAGTAAEALRAEAASLPQIALEGPTLSDLYLISVGALSPLDGFMDSAAWTSVVDSMTLPDGRPWAIPIVLPASHGEAEALKPGDRAALVAEDGEIAGVITVTEIFDRDLEREAKKVFGTPDLEHPGVAMINRLGSRCVAGPVQYCYPEDISGHAGDHMTPSETRAAFKELGWDTIVAFQTRNPIHRAHEYIQKCALEIVDGLLVHPLVGETKADDIPADIRMECYKVLLDRYFPEGRTVLSVLPAAMRYAGPCEAIHHAIMRRNYGCTHFIVGRDHAGVGDYYGTYDAQHIFDDIDGEELGIRPLKFEHAFFCTVTGQMATPKTSPAKAEEKIFLSGTKVREMLSRGERPPSEFTRAEVADVLMRAYQA
jgi:sulfate adenylyltransferase